MKEPLRASHGGAIKISQLVGAFVWWPGLIPRAHTMEGGNWPQKCVFTCNMMHSWARVHVHMHGCIHTQISPQTWGSTCHGPVETGQACLASLRCGPSTLEWKRMAWYATGLWGKRILVCWNKSFCCCFPRVLQICCGFLPFPATVQSLASTKGSSSMLEKALPFLPCPHSTVEKEILRRKDSALLLEAEEECLSTSSWILWKK